MAFSRGVRGHGLASQHADSQHGVLYNFSPPVCCCVLIEVAAPEGKREPEKEVGEREKFFCCSPVYATGISSLWIFPSTNFGVESASSRLSHLPMRREP